MKEKAIVYCVQDDHLLVFRHVDFSYEEVGIQVPAGTIREDETPEQAALRELCEETGRDTFEIICELGTATYNMSPYRDEIQHRHFFLAKQTLPVPIGGRWFSLEEHDGQEPPTVFQCFWIPLKNAHVLQSGQGALLYRINEALNPRPSSESGTAPDGSPRN